MAIFRKIHTSFWSDSYISELERDKKLFYLYLLTNERTTQCGIYEITKKQISFDLGYSIDTVSNLIKYFEKSGRIKYNEQTKEIAIKNWLKYNGSTSPKVQLCINKEFKMVKDTLLIQYLNSMDTCSQEEQEEEQEKEENKPQKKSIDDRKKLFYSKVAEFAGQYPKEMLRNFYDYWTESDGKKMLFETKPIFEVAKRLATWNKKNNTYETNKGKQPNEYVIK